MKDNEVKVTTGFKVTPEQRDELQAIIEEMQLVGETNGDTLMRVVTAAHNNPVQKLVIKHPVMKQIIDGYMANLKLVDSVLNQTDSQIEAIQKERDDALKAEQKAKETAYEAGKNAEQKAVEADQRVAEANEELRREKEKTAEVVEKYETLKAVKDGYEELKQLIVANHYGKAKPARELYQDEA